VKLKLNFFNTELIIDLMAIEQFSLIKYSVIVVKFNANSTALSNYVCRWFSSYC